MPAPGEGTLQFRFPTQQGMTYAVQDSTDLVHWNDIEGGIAGQGAVVTRSYSTASQSKRYFRVRRN